MILPPGIIKGEGSLYCWPPVWLVWIYFANKNKNCQWSYNWFQTSLTGGQRTVILPPLVFPGRSIKALSRKSHWRGRLSTVELLVLTNLDHLLFMLKKLFTFFYKTSSLIKEVNGTLKLPPSVFPAQLAGSAFALSKLKVRLRDRFCNRRVRTT